ncbi:hypothetical protein PanWU01x14_314090 [Parasponia andersonii]|uniref:Uncharacterized protein n=1 Tax=Parasponia andersonii TaxID=3476 RepID=A0A2P5ANV8_PARAD|nr:hypothetical protein PanWU01x14_314090 [Parasponia andersonii]
MSPVCGQIVAGDKNSEMAKNGIFPTGEHGGFAGPTARVTGGTARQAGRMTSKLVAAAGLGLRP